MPILFVFVRRLYLRRGRVHWCYAQPWEEEEDEAQALHIHITFRIRDYGLLLCKLFSTEDCPTILGPLIGCNILFNRARTAYSAILSCQSVCIFNYFCAYICIVLYRYNYVCVLAEHSINKYQRSRFPMHFLTLFCARKGCILCKANQLKRKKQINS